MTSRPSKLAHRDGGAVTRLRRPPPPLSWQQPEPHDGRHRDCASPEDPRFTSPPPIGSSEIGSSCQLTAQQNICERRISQFFLFTGSPVKVATWNLKMIPVICATYDWFFSHFNLGKINQFFSFNTMCKTALTYRLEIKVLLHFHEKLHRWR